MENAGGAPSLRLTYRSPDGEEGYPGTVDAAVNYTVTRENVFLVETEASTDRPTPFSLTMHPYFNLGGEGSGSIADHELQIYADEFVSTDESMTLLGRIESVTGRSNDFRQLRNLGDAIPSLFKITATSIPCAERDRKVLDPSPFPPRVWSIPPADAFSKYPPLKRICSFIPAPVSTDLLRESPVPAMPRHAGVCLECEGYPDGANAPSLGDIILRPKHPQRHTTAYAFSTEP